MFYLLYLWLCPLFQPAFSPPRPIVSQFKTQLRLLSYNAGLNIAVADACRWWIRDIDNRSTLASDNSLRITQMLYRKGMFSPIDQNFDIRLICNKYQLDMIMIVLGGLNPVHQCQKALWKEEKNSLRLGWILHKHFALCISLKIPGPQLNTLCFVSCMLEVVSWMLWAVNIGTRIYTDEHGYWKIRQLRWS